MPMDAPPLPPRKRLSSPASSLPFAAAAVKSPTSASAPLGQSTRRCVTRAAMTARGSSAARSPSRGFSRCARRTATSPISSFLDDRDHPGEQGMFRGATLPRFQASYLRSMQCPFKPYWELYAYLRFGTCATPRRSSEWAPRSRSRPPRPCACTRCGFPQLCPLDSPSRILSSHCTA